MESINLLANQSIRPSEQPVSAYNRESVYRVGVAAKMFLYGAVLIEGPEASANRDLLNSVEDFLNSSSCARHKGVKTLLVEGGADFNGVIDEQTDQLITFANHPGPKTLLVDKLDDLLSLNGNESDDHQREGLIQSLAGYVVGGSAMMSLVATAKKPLSVKNNGSELSPEQESIIGLFSSEDARYQFYGFDKGRRLAEKVLAKDRFELFYESNAIRFLSGLSNMGLR